MPAAAVPPIVLRSSRAVCDVCLAEVPATLELEAGAIYHRKRCPAHGERSWRISRNADEYRRYDRHYHTLFPAGETPPAPVDTYFAITNRCNQACDYCCVEANRFGYCADYDLARFERELPRLPSRKVGLVGGEPLMHPAFFAFVEKIAAARRTAVVFTNGLGFAEEQAVRRLVAASRGRCIVRFTFEGFTDEDYLHLRLPRARERKLAALAHFERHRVAVTLGHTITAAEQDDRPRLRRVMRGIIEHAMRVRTISGVTFSALAALGGSRGRPPESVMSVDEVMDEITLACPVPTDRAHVYLAQRLTHCIARLFGLPMCEYHQAALLLRSGGTWRGLDHLVDCARLADRLDARLSGWPRTRPGLLAALSGDLLACARPAQAPSLMRLGFSVLPLFFQAFDYREIPEGILPINAGTVCDPLNFDAGVARRCEKAAYSEVAGSAVVETISQMVMRHLVQRHSGG